MSRPFSTADFTAQITADRTWRIKEISDLKDAVINASSQKQKVLLRSLVTICYAHWEGYVRLAAGKYMEHIALRKFRYDQLDRQFLKNYFLPRLNALSASKASLKDRCALVDEIEDAKSRRFSRLNADLINTKSNLNFVVFGEICLICGLPTTSFESKADFIDIFLLKRRNSIAHGEETFIDSTDLDELTTGTVTLMRTFGDLLENHVYTTSFKAPAEQVTTSP